MTARHLHKAQFTFEPRFLMTMAFNDLPRITGGDDGFWRRMRLIRFRHQFSVEEIERAGNIDQAFEAEASGILNWLLEGLAGWFKHGLAPTAAMEADILDYRSQSNPFDEWWRERIILEAGARTPIHDIFEDYDSWCDEENIDPRARLSSRRFAILLSNRQLRVTKSGRERYRVGEKLAPKKNRSRAADDQETDE